MEYNDKRKQRPRTPFIQETPAKSINPSRPGGGGGGGRGATAHISTIEKFFDVYVIPTKSGDFYLKFIGELDFGNIFVKGVTRCRGKANFNVIFSQNLLF